MNFPFELNIAPPSIPAIHFESVMNKGILDEYGSVIKLHTVPMETLFIITLGEISPKGDPIVITCSPF